MSDMITTLGNSLLQHGPNNDRIYLMKLAETDFPEIITKLDNLASQGKYSKIFAKIPEYARKAFLENSYQEEAAIPRFYNGQLHAYFLGKYFTENRKHPDNWDEIEKVLAAAKAKFKPEGQVSRPSGDFACRKCTVTDIPEMAELYKQVFVTYPFPIQSPDYIAETMNSNVTYFGVWENEVLAALASAEMDTKSQNAEMTDFATLPAYRSKGLSSFLLHTMEDYVRSLGLKTAYTIARAVSYGMNITFAKLGYYFSGTLINNTNISGNLESMNVWYKNLD